MRLLLLAAFVLSALPLTAAAQDRRQAGDKFVLPFDFESTFDKGDYGQRLGGMIWAKLKKQGGFVIPDSMLETREWCERNKFAPNPDTPLDRMKQVVVDEQACDVGIWGKIERVPGYQTDVYDLTIVIVDFAASPAKTVYRKSVRTKTVSEIPHTYVQEALDALYGKSGTAVAAGPDPAEEEQWRKAPNLVRGDFEAGTTAPAGWDALPEHVRWAREDGSAGNRTVSFVIPPAVAEATGVLYYSDYFPVEEGARYRFQCRFRTTGTAVKVFVKCYDELPSKFQTPTGKEKREVYRSQQNLQGAANAWTTHTEDFTPSHGTYTPRWGRVMLYAYYPAGTVEWDDVVVKKIAPAAQRVPTGD